MVVAFNTGLNEEGKSGFPVAGDGSTQEILAQSSHPILGMDMVREQKVRAWGSTILKVITIYQGYKQTNPLH